MLQANGGQENIELRGITILFAPDRRRTDLFLNLFTPRTDSDPAHAVDLKFLYSEERYPFYFTAKTFENRGCLRLSLLGTGGYQKS